jgi:lipopolysaccharide export system permease protein
MIIFRYLCREILSATFAVCVVLLLVLISGRFVKYLSKALSGNMDPEVIFAVIGYRIPSFLELTLPLAFCLAILLTFGRLYVENEMSVLKACGISELKLLSFVLVISACMAVLVGWLSLHISPQGIQKAEAIFAAQEQKSELDRLTPKNFYPLRGGKGVTYVDSVGEDGELQDVFLSVTTGGAGSNDSNLVVVVAGEGNQHLTEDGSERFLVFKEGYRVEGVPGQADYQITFFEEYGTRLEPPDELSEGTEIDAMSTQSLIGSDDLAHQVALQWRFSIPLMVIIVALLAVPLSRINPRSGRFTRILPTVILYFIYLVALNAMRVNIEAGTVPVSVTLLPVHLVFLLLALGLLFSDKIKLSVTQKVRSMRVTNHD